MSQHYVERGGLPPGLSSFTKIRLGWITADQVTFVEPGDSAIAFLSPLSRKGKTLAVKIPLSWGSYYLIENRQPVGFDRALPDAGLLLLRVNPNAEEGYGTVKIMNASPSTPQFAKATWRIDAPGRDAYVDDSNRLAVIPLWQEEGNRPGPSKNCCRGEGQSGWWRPARRHFTPTTSRRFCSWRRSAEQ
jgi:hypothetical protein